MFNFGKPAATQPAATATTNTGFSFGSNNTTTNTAPATGGGLFGNTNSTGAAAPATSGGLFGSANATNKPATGGGLFGASNTTNPSATGGGLFGASSTNPPATGGLFGGASTNPPATGGLFGGATNNTATSTTGSTTGGLFGSKPATTLSFGANSTNTMGGLGGGSGTTTGLFGNKPAMGSTINTLGSGNSLFGNNAASNFNNNNNMMMMTGTNQISAIQQISQLQITPMTRIIDLPPQLRQEIEQLDQYIQRQVTISNHLKAETNEHIELIQSIPRDIAYLNKNQSLTNQSLSKDLKKILNLKSLTDQNLMDTEFFTILLNQLLTPGSKISSLELDKFFQNKIQSYTTKLDDFSRVLSDIESAVSGINNDLFGTSLKSEHIVSTSSTNLSENTQSSRGVKPSIETNINTAYDSSGNNNNNAGINNNGGYSINSCSNVNSTSLVNSSDIINLKTGLNAIVTTVIEEFKLFMDLAQRIAELHQKVKEATSVQQ